MEDTLMSLHGWSGPGKLRELRLDRTETPTITELTGPYEHSSTVHAEKLHVCTVDDCGKRFKLRAILARHFTANHEELRKDKDSWRDHTEEIWE